MKQKTFKKNIFIAGAVRVFDSSNPTPFIQGIDSYLKANILPSDWANKDIGITAVEVNKEITIRVPLTTGNEYDAYTISRELYCCFTGNCASNVAKHSSVWWTLSFGPDYPMNVRFSIDQIVKEHKKNTRYYKANRYKSLELEEDAEGLTIKFQY